MMIIKIFYCFFFVWDICKNSVCVLYGAVMGLAISCFVIITSFCIHIIYKYLSLAFMREGRIYTLLIVAHSTTHTQRFHMYKTHTIYSSPIHAIRAVENVCGKTKDTQNQVTVAIYLTVRVIVLYNCWINYSERWGYVLVYVKVCVFSIIIGHIEFIDLVIYKFKSFECYSYYQSCEETYINCSHVRKSLFFLFLHKW